jgi:hypothetical protein
MRNKLTDLNDHLFAEIERLGEESLKGESLKEEIFRANAIAGVAEQVIANGNLVLKAHIASVEWSPMKDNKSLPVMLE